MFKSFTNRYKSNLARIQRKNVKVFNIISTLALTLTELQRARKIVESGGEIHGYQTISIQRWVDDENGPIELNGKTGYYLDEEFIEKNKENLLTLNGRDLFHAQDYTNTAAGTRGSGFIALSDDATAPSNTDTSVAGEITTGGLSRVDADTKTHTNGTNVTTLIHTFTATSVHTDVQKSGLFNASSGITLTHENTFTPVTLQINDTLKVTWTLTLG